MCIIRAFEAFVSIVVFGSLLASADSADSVKKNDRKRVAILGDSITYDGRWATQVEDALRDSAQFSDAEIVNFGLGSETVSGLSEPGHAGGKFPRPCLHERLGRILEQFKPTMVLACYGMNDGIYLPLDEKRTKAFQDGCLKLKTAVESTGARLIFITPPLHAADGLAKDANSYDAVLDHYGQWLISQRAMGWSVIDIRPDLRQAIAEECQKTPFFIYAKDKVHPEGLGHEFIAHSVISQLWPLLKLPGTPRLTKKSSFPLLLERNVILKHAWLTKTGHTRPGVPNGKPLEEAERLASQLLQISRQSTESKP